MLSDFANGIAARVPPSAAVPVGELSTATSPVKRAPGL
jgi:hypothetical protein